MQTHFTQPVIALARGVAGEYTHRTRKEEVEEEEEADKPKT